MSDARESRGQLVQENRWSQDTSGRRMISEVDEVGMFIMKDVVSCVEDC